MCSGSSAGTSSSGSSSGVCAKDASLTPARSGSFSADGFSVDCPARDGSVFAPAPDSSRVGAFAAQAPSARIMVSTNRTEFSFFHFKPSFCFSEAHDADNRAFEAFAPGCAFRLKFHFAFLPPSEVFSGGCPTAPEEGAYLITKTIEIGIGDFSFEIKSETDNEIFALLTSLN